MSQEGDSFLKGEGSGIQGVSQTKSGPNQIKDSYLGAHSSDNEQDDYLGGASSEEGYGDSEDGLQNDLKAVSKTPIEQKINPVANPGNNFNTEQSDVPTDEEKDEVNLSDDEEGDLNQPNSDSDDDSVDIAPGNNMDATAQKAETPQSLNSSNLDARNYSQANQGAPVAEPPTVQLPVLAPENHQPNDDRRDYDTFSPNQYDTNNPIPSPIGNHAEPLAEVEDRNATVQATDLQARYESSPPPVEIQNYESNYVESPAYSREENFDPLTSRFLPMGNAENFNYYPTNGAHDDQENLDHAYDQSEEELDENLPMPAPSTSSISALASTSFMSTSSLTTRRPNENVFYPGGRNRIDVDRANEQYLREQEGIHNSSNVLTRQNTKRQDDSALGLHPFAANDLSQMLNPNISQILKEDYLLNNHRDTESVKDHLTKFLNWMNFRVKNDNTVLKTFAFSKIKTHPYGSKSPIWVLENQPGRKNLAKSKKLSVEKISVLSGIYDKMKKTKAITIWYEVMCKARNRELYSEKLARMYIVFLQGRTNAWKKEAFNNILARKNEVLQREEDARRDAEEARMKKQQNESMFMKLWEKLRSLEIKNKNYGFNSIRFDAEDAYGGTRRNPRYRKKAASMQFGHMLERIFERTKRDAYNSINDHNNFPGVQRILRASEKVRDVLVPRLRNIFGREFMLRLKAWHDPKTRENATNIKDVLEKIYKNRLNSGLRAIYQKNLSVLKNQKKMMFFYGLVNKLVKEVHQRNLKDGFIDIYKAYRQKMLKEKNAKLLALKIVKLISNQQADAFNRVRRIPEIAEKFYIANKRLERSMKLRAALKIGNYFGKFVDKAMNERVRKVLSFLRRFNHQYKKPIYHQTLTNFVNLLEKKKKLKLKEGIELINKKGTVYLLKKFFNEAVDLKGNLNDEVIFALDNNVRTANLNLNRMIEFWNTTYEVDEPVVMEPDQPDSMHMDIVDPLGEQNPNIFDTEGLLNNKPSKPNKNGDLQFTPNYKSNKKRSNNPYYGDDHPYNRHSEVTSCDKKLFTRNSVTPVAHGRASPKPTNKFGYDLASTMPSTTPKLSSQDKRILAREYGMMNGRKPAGLETPKQFDKTNEFDNFMESVPNGNKFTSFSAQKDDDKLFREAYEQSQMLSDLLEDKFKEVSDQSGSNVFFN